MRGPSAFSLVATLLLLTGVSSAASPQDLLASGHVDDAVQVLEQQVRQAPSDAAGHNLLCRAYFMAEEWDRGISACERASSLDPQNSLHYLWLGRIYGEKAARAGFLSAAGLGKKSRAAFERAVELDPRNWEARKDLAEFYFSAPGIVGGGKDKARDQAEAIRALNPAAADWVAGQIAEKNKDYVAAEREYRAAIAASHSGVWAWTELAIFFRHINRLDDMEKALHEVENAAAVDHHEALMDAASLLVRTGRDPALGIRLLRRYFSVGPVEQGPAYKAHEYWGQLLERQGDHRGAAAEYHAALALFHNYRRAEEDLKRVEH